jgi:hypothetical protein
VLRPEAYAAILGLLACGARSSLNDDGAGGEGASITVAANASTASTASTGGGAGCTPRLLGVDASGGIRIELTGDTVVYTTASGFLVRADLGPLGTSAPPEETVIARGIHGAGDIAIHDAHVYYTSSVDDTQVVVRRVPLAGGLEEDIFVPQGVPGSLEVDASGVYLTQPDIFIGRVLRLAPDGTTSVLVDLAGDAWTIGLTSSSVLGFASTLPGESDAGLLYTVPKAGGPHTVISGQHFGVRYVRMIDGALHWYEPSSSSPGSSDLFSYDPASGVLSTLAALPDGALSFGEDQDRIYVTSPAFEAGAPNSIYAVDRSGAVRGRFVDDHAERYPTEIRAGGGRVAWTVGARSGNDVEVPSVQIECATSFD